MIYQYNCVKCKTTVEISKPMVCSEQIENCMACGFQMSKIVTGGSGFLYKKNEWPEYNPAFGKIVKNSGERKELAKQNNLVEVGSESMESLDSDLESIRKKKRSWDDV